MISGLDQGDINFPVSKKDYVTLKKTAFALTQFVTEMVSFIQFLYQMKNLKVV